MIKKIVAAMCCLSAVNGLNAAKSWIGRIENTSPFYVTYQNTDPSAKNIVNKHCWMRQEPFVIGPKSTITLEDAVIPWQSFGGLIKISVNGVELSGNPFTTAQATVQEVAGEIWLDTGIKRDKVTRADAFTILIGKDGSVSLK